MTLGVFPAPIADELLYGVLARHGFLAGSPNAAEHATELFGRRSAVATFDLPSGLDALASRLPASLGLDGRKAMHPLLHLLMDGLLRHLRRGGSISEELTGARSATRSAGEPSLAADARTVRTPRLDWPALDERLRRGIAEQAASVLALSPPMRVTPAEVERRVAKTGWFGKRRRKLPLATAALASVEEPLAAFRRRRVIHWAAELGPACRPREVMRAAGLRSEHLPMIRAAMSERAAGSAGR